MAIDFPKEMKNVSTITHDELHDHNAESYHVVNFIMFDY